MRKRNCRPRSKTQGIEWAQAHRIVYMLDGQIRLAEKDFRPSIVDQRPRQIGTERERSVENSGAVVEVVDHKDERITCS